MELHTLKSGSALIYLWDVDILLTVHFIIYILYIQYFK